MTRTLRTLTRKDVEEHNLRSSSWLVIENKVYDVTPFLEEHPGGIEVLLEHAGKDATEAFEEVGHSADAKELREQYLIGEIVESERKAVQRRVQTPVTPNTSILNSTWSNLLIPAAMSVLVLLSYRFVMAYFQQSH